MSGRGAGKTTCTSAGSASSVTPTGLNAATAYVFTAYSDSSCSNLLATAPSFTTPVSVSTLSGSDTGTVDVGQSTNQVKAAAQAFTTGNNSGGYTLSSIAIGFRAALGSPPNLEVTLHAASGSNPNTGTTLATLNGSDPTTAGTYTYTCSTGCDLSASTTYFVYMKAPNAANGSYYRSTLTTATHTQQPSNNGWAIADEGRVQYSGAIWIGAGGSSAYRIKVTATPK